MSTRWGVVGAGWVARDYVLPAIVADPRAHLAAVCDRDRTARDAVRALPGTADALVTDDLDTLLACAPDAVYVATPNHAHASVVRAVAAAGVPVLCEKPLAHDVADAAAIVEAVGRARGGRGVLAGTAFDQRFHPAHAAIAACVAGGDLGVVTTVRVVYGCWLPPEWAPPTTAGADLRAARPDNWRADPARAGGGAMIDLAPHGVDLVGRLLSEDLTTLTALAVRRVHDYADPTADDTAVLTGATDSGVLFSQHVSFSTADPLPRRRLEVVGTCAQLVAVDTMGQTPGGTLTRIDAATGASTPVSFDAAASPFAHQLAAFGAAVRGERPWPWPVARDLALHRLLLDAPRPVPPARPVPTTGPATVPAEEPSPCP